jgi:hypothetical protein
MAKNNPLKGLPSDKGKGKGKGGGKGKGKGKGGAGGKGGKGGKGGDGGGSKGDINEQMFNFQKREAERAREEETERKHKIKKGMAKIDTAFAGFDDNFYNTREAAYKGFYTPQLTDQFTKARENLTFALSRAGTLNSTVAGQKSADLTKDYDVNVGLINSKAAADRAATQGKINEEKSALVSQLNATAQANQVGDQATARTQQLASEAPDYNPLGDIFFGAAQGVGGLVQSAQNAQYSTAAGLTGPRTTGVSNSRTLY